MEENEERDWAAGLPSEVICTIAQRLPVAEYLRLHAVCTMWASALTTNVLLPTPSKHFPWLGLSKGDAKPSFLVWPFEDNGLRYQLPLIPFADDGKWIGFRDGWIVIFQHLECPPHYHSLRLFNPVTGAQLSLPSFSNTPLKHSGIQKVVLSSLIPSSTITAIAMPACQPRCLVFARPGNKTWMTLHAHSASESDLDFIDVVYHHGHFVAISRQGYFHTFDLDGSPHKEAVIVMANVECLSSSDIYLVSAPSGDLFMVMEKNDRSLEDNDGGSMTRNFSIMKYKPDKVVDSCNWVEIKDLGHTSFFLDKYHSASLSVRDIPGLRKNCIYFAAPNFSILSENVGYFVNDVRVFDVEKGTSESCCPREFRCMGGWNLIAPIWFMPSLL